MAAHDYHFVTTWRVAAPPAEVSAVLADALDLVRWWPSVYLAADEVAPGAADGTGREIALYTKGWLPYTLRWRFRVTEIVPGRTLALDATGDFVGRGVWTFAPAGDGASLVTYDWRIRAAKPLLRRLSWLLKPVFGANHRWAMAMGERSLALELARRRAPDAAARARVPAPPGPTFGWLLPPAADRRAAGPPPSRP